MAALNFPSSPTVGQTYTANGLTYEWNGESWVTFNVLQDLTVNDSNTGDASPVTYDGFTAKTISSNTVGAIHKAASSTDNAVVRFDGTTGDVVQNSVVTIDDAGNIVGLDSAKFSGTPPVSTTSGTLWYDSTNNSLNFQQNAITQQVGEEIFIYGKASAAITEGQLICKTGTVGASGVITFAPSPANLTTNDGIIGVATENIALNDFGRITYFGIVHGINTTGSSVGETWADNDTLWYNPAGSGKLTNVKPSAPNIKFGVATVINAGSGGSGSIQVLLEAGSTLGGTDSNVQLSTASNGNVLTYDGAAGYWKNTDLTAGTGISVTKASDGTLTVANTSPSSGGTVTSVTGTTPVSVTTGTTTPVISMAAATSSVNGYLTSTDWTTFNGKAPAVTYTTNYIPYGQGTTTPLLSSGLQYNGTTFSTTNDASISGLTVGKGGGAVAGNVAIGASALLATNTGGNMVAIGANASKSATSASSCIAIGANALFVNTTGYSNIAIGTYDSTAGYQGALFSNTGNLNTVVGQRSMSFNTSGSNNACFGAGASIQNITGGNNTALGAFALQANTTASNITAVGYSALYNNTTGVATLGTVTGGTGYTNGTYTGVVMTLSSGSTAFTYPTATIVVAGGVVTTVTITSAGAGFKDTTTVLTAPAASIGGTGSGFSVPVATLVSGTTNTAVGYQAGYGNTIGTLTAVGYQAALGNTTGTGNTAVGISSLASNLTGTGNTGIGTQAITGTTTSNNTAVGFQALFTNSNGSTNDAFGYRSLFSNTSGTTNAAFGVSSLRSNTTGSNNVGLGNSAGYGNASANANTTGSNNTYVGYQTVGSANNNTNEMVIGYQAVGLGSNTTVIGNSSTTLTKTFGVHVTSGYTVATLPAGTTGARAYVTDATAPTFLGTLTGGGAVTCPVFYNGSAWVAG